MPMMGRRRRIRFFSSEMRLTGDTSVRAQLVLQIAQIENSAMAPKKLGVGAVCEVLLKHVRPRKCLSDAYPNPEKGERLSGLLAFKQEVKRVSKKDQLCVVFRHDQFPGKELFCVKRWSKVTHDNSL